MEPGGRHDAASYAPGTVVVGLHRFVAYELTEELSFERGDRIVITGEAGKGWAKGKLEHMPSTRGFFPLSLVVPESDTEAREATLTDADVQALADATENLACKQCACELFTAQLWNPLKCGECFHAFAVHARARSAPPPASHASTAAALAAAAVRGRTETSAAQLAADFDAAAEVAAAKAASSTSSAAAATPFAHVPSAQLANTQLFAPMVLYKVLSCVGLEDDAAERVCELLQVKTAHLPVLLRRSHVRNLEALASDTERFIADQRLLRGIVRLQAAVRMRAARKRYTTRLSGENREAVQSIVRVFRDLFVSERAYINDLLVIVDDYLLPLRKQARTAPSDANNSSSGGSSSPGAKLSAGVSAKLGRNAASKLVPAQTLAAIFSSIELILETHRSLYADLLRIRNAPEWPLLHHIGDALLKAAPDFACYRLYVEGFKDAMSMLDAETARNAAFVAFLERTYERCSAQRNCWADLRGLLSAPLNRITKYENALYKLNAAPLEHVLGASDAHSVLHAYTIVGQQSEVVRADLQAAEHTAQIKALKRELSGVEGPFELQKEGRRLVKDGVLASATSKKKRRVVLFTDMCIVATPKGKGYRVKYLHGWNDCEVRAVESSASSGAASGGDAAYEAAIAAHMAATDPSRAASPTPSTSSASSGSSAAGFVFEVAPAGSEAYSFTCATAKERERWMQAIGELISAGNADRVFGVPLDVCLAKCSSSSTAEAEESAHGAGNALPDAPELALLPRALRHIARHLLRHVAVDGIFRESGSKDQIEKLMKALDSGELPPLRATNPHSVAGLFKQWFRALPEPLFPFATYEKIVYLQSFVVAQDTQGSEQHRAALREIIADFAPAHRTALRCLVRFMQHFIEAENRMGAQNLAIVFAPITCYPKQITFSSTLETPGVIATLKFLFEEPSLVEDMQCSVSLKV